MSELTEPQTPEAATPHCEYCGEIKHAYIERDYWDCGSRVDAADNHERSQRCRQIEARNLKTALANAEARRDFNETTLRNAGWSYVEGAAAWKPPINTAMGELWNRLFTTEAQLTEAQAACAVKDEALSTLMACANPIVKDMSDVALSTAAAHAPDEESRKQAAALYASRKALALATTPADALAKWQAMEAYRDTARAENTRLREALGKVVEALNGFKARVPELMHRSSCHKWLRAVAECSCGLEAQYVICDDALAIAATVLKEGK